MDSFSIRSPAVAGTFYPDAPDRLEALVRSQLDPARLPATSGSVVAGRLVGLLVPHAGLAYSGLVAAAAWRLLPEAAPKTVVVLGTNHSAGWLRGVGTWERGAWRTPLGDVRVDTDLGAAIVALGEPFLVDRAAHVDEHSIEVQLPFLQIAAPGAEIVPLAVALGTSERARNAGRRLGRLLAERRRAGENIVLAISTDMAHYPPADLAAAVTESLLPAILAVDPGRLAALESTRRGLRESGLVCGMCGIEPAIVGLAALAEMGATGVELMAATSADAGGSRGRTVGYLSVAFLLRHAAA